MKTKFDQRQKNALVKDYRRGLSIPALSRKYQIHAQTCIRYVLAAGEPPPSERNAQLNKELTAEVKRLIEKRYTHQEIADELKLTKSRVRYLAEQAGMTREKRNARVMELFASGHTRRAIAATVGLDHSTVARIIQKEKAKK